MWALARPKIVPNQFKQIIVVSFYAPPKTRKSEELLEHITVNLQLLLQKYPNAGIIIAGDRNNVSIERLQAIDHSLKQIVLKPTRKLKTLDVILTNMHRFYNEPIIVPPVQPDDVNNGVPSDHSVPVASARTCNKSRREYRTRCYRPFPASGIHRFGEWITKENWLDIQSKTSPSEAVATFELIFSTHLEQCLPLKYVRGPVSEKPWITMELSQLARQKQREYTKNGKSNKYLNLREKFNKEQKIAIDTYRQKQLSSIKKSNIIYGYSVLKKMGAKLGESFHEEITLPCHDGMSTEAIVENIANHFCRISNEYKALEYTDLSHEILDKIINVNKNDIPQVTEREVSVKIRSAKTNNSSIPGDIPKKIIQEFAVELVAPLTDIINKSLDNLEYPQNWKKEYATPIPKIPNPLTNDDLRLISLTKFSSKIFEKFIAEWISEIVGPNLDPAQFGGLKGNAISHYLIHLINFILSNMDSPKPTAVLTAVIDFSKAFNRISHKRIIEIMHEMCIPGWLLKLTISYLTQRTLVVRYKGCTSTEKKMPGGTPAGTVLGVLAFILQIDGIRISPLTPYDEIISAPSVKQKNTLCKFIDDMTVGSVVKLKDDLEILENAVHPVSYQSNELQI